MLFVPPDFIFHAACPISLPTHSPCAYVCLQEKVARKFGSVDVHAAVRQRLAKEKEAQQLQLQNDGSDAWMPDRFYTEELKQVTL